MNRYKVEWQRYKMQTSEKVYCVWNILKYPGIGFPSMSVSRNALKMPISTDFTMFQPYTLFLTKESRAEQCGGKLAES